MPRWCAEIYRYSIGNCGHLVVRQCMAVWTNATKKKCKRYPYFNRKLGLFVCFPALRNLSVFICVLIPCGANRFRNDAPVLLNFWNSEPKSPEWLVVARGNAKPNPNWHKCLHEHAWTKCKASAPNHVWDLGATETWGTRKSRDPCFVQFSKFGKNSVKVPPILCEAETTSPSTAVPHGLMVEFITRPAPPQTRNVWFDVCISENIEN